MNRVLTVLALALVPLAAAVVALTSGALPPTVATHFGPGGRGTGWMPHGSYVVLMSGLTLAAPLATWIGLAWLPRRWPALVNLPMRDHWLAPTRRAVTLAALGGFAGAVTLVTSGFLLGMHLLILDANAQAPPRLAQSAFVVLLGLFLAAIAGIVSAFAWRFRRTG